VNVPLVMSMRLLEFAAANWVLLVLSTLIMLSPTAIFPEPSKDVPLMVLMLVPETSVG
jgi:hypothetical protein